MSAKHLQVTILYLLIDLILLTVEFNDIFKFSGYKPENINGNTKTCYDSPLNCTQSCMLDELCTAIATRNETARCDLFLLVYYGRVILKRNFNYTTWAKGMRFYFHCKNDSSW